jgi:hypothetical protein
MRITGKTFFGTSKELGEALKPLYYPRAAEMRAVVTDYLEMARRRKDFGWAHADMQLHLAMSLHVELSFLQQLRAAELNTEEETRLNHYTQQATRSAANALTQVADGIAFRFLNYNLGLCHAFLGNQVSPYAVKQQGFMNVLDVATAVLDRSEIGSQILICDLNSITNEGDYILRNSDGYEVVEVKQGLKRRGSRLTRQTDRLQQLSDFINQRKGIRDGVECELVDVPSRTHNFHLLEECFRVASSAGFAVKQITDYQSITCLDTNSFTERESKEVIEDAQRQVAAIWNDERTIELSSIHTRQWAGNVVPMSVFPLGSELIAGLLMGDKIFISTISLDALFDFVARRGWDVVDLTETDMENQPWPVPALAFLIDEKNQEHTTTLSVDLLIASAVNLITVESSLDPIKQLLPTQRKNFNWMPSYPSEADIWL